MQGGQHQVEDRRLDVAGVIHAIDRCAIGTDVVVTRRTVSDADGAQPKPNPASAEPVQDTRPLEYDSQQNTWGREEQHVGSDADVGRQRPYTRYSRL